MLPTQGTWVRSLIRKPDPTCCNQDMVQPNKSIFKKRNSLQVARLGGNEPLGTFVAARVILLHTFESVISLLARFTLQV